MAIDTPHPEYTAMLPEWQRMRHVLAGQSEMRVHGDTYLRRAPGMTDPAQWQQYVDSAPFFEAAARTLEGLSGLAFYNPPEIIYPPALQAFIDDCTGDGVPLRTFLKLVEEEVLSIGRLGVMVDYPPKDPAVTNRLEEERTGRRAYARRYEAETIFNWRTVRIGSQVKLAEVRLFEFEETEVDEWTTERRAIIRVLQLVKLGGRLIYQQRIFKARDPEEDSAVPVRSRSKRGRAKPATQERQWDAGTVYTPLIDGKPLDYIPFWIVNPVDQSPEMRKPPMLGIANVNVAHFNTSAQLENALFWSGNPQPWIAGVDPAEAKPLLIGGSEAWLIKDPNGKVGFLSLESDKLQALENRLNRHEQHMAILGARMLSADKRQVEAAETARIHRQGEVSVLAGTSGSVSLAMTDVLRVVRDWELASGDVSVALVTDFFDEILTPEGAAKLVEIWFKGAIGYPDLLSNLKRGGIVDPERTVEQIMSDIQSGPVQPIFPVLPNSDDPEDKDKDKNKPPKPKPAPPPAA